MTTSGRAVRIAVDAMGGDYAPEVNLKGTLQALEESANLHVLLVGKREVLGKSVKETDRLTFVHADSGRHGRWGSAQADAVRAGPTALNEFGGRRVNRGVIVGDDDARGVDSVGRDAGDDGLLQGTEGISRA